MAERKAGEESGSRAALEDLLNITGQYVEYEGPTPKKIYSDSQLKKSTEQTTLYPHCPVPAADSR